MNPPASVSAVVVPVDGSSLSCRAIPVGIALARRLEATLHLFSAVPTADDVDERDAALADLLAGIGDLPSTRTVVVDPDVPGAIHEELRRLKPALGCMATRGRGRSAALFGSVVVETLARAHDALVLVGPFVGDGPKPGHEPRGLMVCVDSSPWSSCLVGISVAYAQRLGEPLVIATVAEPVPEPVRPHPGHRRFGPDGDVEEFLAALAAPVAGEGVDVSTLAIWDPVSPADGVAHHLRDHPALLAMVGSRARTGVARLAFGSVATSIVLHSRSPVFVIPRRDVG